MSIESIGILADPTHRQPNADNEVPPDRPAPDSGGVVDSEVGGDRFDGSVAARHRDMAKRFRRLANDAFERPEHKHGIAKQLEHRFRDALHTLKKVGALDPHEVKTLRKAFRHALKAIESTGTAAAELTGESHVEQSRTYSLDVETVEGDTVQIRLQRQTRIDESFTASSDGDDAVSLEAERTVASSSSLGFTVVGDLNEDERAAIADLVARVDQLAVRFFDGDVRAALEYSREFGLPDDEIAAFSVDLGYSLEAQAVTAYREVAALGSPAGATDESAAQDLFEDLRSLAESTRLERLFVDSRRLVFDFFRSAVESGAGDTDS